MLNQIQEAPLFNILRRFVPLLPVAAFLGFFLVSYVGSLHPGTLAIKGGPCDDGWCITYAFPPGHAWVRGVREGDQILAVEGQSPSTIGPSFDWNAVSSVTIANRAGEVITVTPVAEPIARSPLKWSLWGVAAAVAVLGSLVWSRRPDLASARAFGHMSTAGAIGLAVAPAAGGPALPWALIAQWISLAALGPTFFSLVARLVREQDTGLLPAVRSGLLIACPALITIYILVIAFSPSSYSLVQSALFLMLGLSLIASIALLFAASLTSPDQSQRNRIRAPLIGMALGILPFVATILIPVALGKSALLPPYLAILPVALIPASFAYTILRSHLWGIRRLVHRGLVYLLLSAVVFGIVVLPILLMDRLLHTDHESSIGELALVAILLIVGIYLYHPLRALIRKGIDSLIYGGAVSYPEFIQGLQRDISSAEPDSDLPETITRTFTHRLNLESCLLFRPGDDGKFTVAAAAGARTDRVLEAIRNEQIKPLVPERIDGPIVLPYEGEQLLCVQIWTTENIIGVFLLGPKEGGELFVQDEINLIVNTAPFIAAALDRHDLSKTMRQLNKRLVETEERSRQRMAIDLHDGPLQKAVTLAIGRVADPAEQREVATELVNELREIGSRLRPSILDDLGLPSSLEWLLDHNMRGTGIRGSLLLQGMDEDFRLPSDVELTLFRITQEAINNAVKHSQASELRVTLSREDEQLTLTIRDNGVGVEGATSNKIASSRLGLVGMRERAMQVGGHLEVHSKPGEGVFIQATIPYQEHGFAEVIEAEAHSG